MATAGTPVVRSTSLNGAEPVNVGWLVAAAPQLTTILPRLAFTQPKPNKRLGAGCNRLEMAFLTIL